MDDRRTLLRSALIETGTSQSALGRMSGVQQSSISQFVAGRAPFSDEMLERLLACMGLRLEIVRRAEPAEMSRSDRMRWALHRRLAEMLSDGALDQWLPHAQRNLAELRSVLRGEPHLGNLERWEAMLRTRDLRSIRHAMTGLDADAIALREVSPLRGLLSQQERAHVLSEIAA